MAARNYIELIEKALRVLEILAKGDDGCSLKEIAAEANLVKSSAFRILFTLRELGYVEQDAERGTYRLSLKILGLARGAAGKATLVKVARPCMESLRDELGESVWLAERRSDGVYLVDEAESNRPIRLLLRIGDFCPLHATAVGKAVAAFLGEEEFEAAVSQLNLTQFTSRTITGEETFRKHIEQVRRNGYAVNEEETIEGALLVGAPIFDAGHRVCAAVSVAAPSNRSSANERQRMVTGVRDCAQKITAALAELVFEASMQQPETVYKLTG